MLRVFDLLLVLGLLTAATPEIWGQEPDLEVCVDPLVLILGNEPAGCAFPYINCDDDGISFCENPDNGNNSGYGPVRFVEIEVGEKLTFEDVQVYLSMSGGLYPPNHNALHPVMGIESPLGTRVELTACGNAPVGSTNIEYTLSDFGAEYGTVSEAAGLRVMPTLFGDEQSQLEDFSGESSDGTWTFDARVCCSNLWRINRLCLRFYSERRLAPVQELSCETLPDDQVEVSWVNSEDYDSVEVRINGVLEETLDGPFDVDAEESYETVSLAAPQYVEIEIVPFSVVSGEGHPESCRSVVVGAALVDECDSPDEEYTEDVAAQAVLTVTEDVTITDIQVDLDLGPNLRGLSVVLTSPSGTEVQLFGRCDSPVEEDCGVWGISRRGQFDGLDTTIWCLGRDFYPPYDDPSVAMRAAGPQSLSELFGESAEGDWVLEAGGATGKGTINEWCIRVYDEVPPAAVRHLACEPGQTSGDFNVTWECGAGYDEILVFVDGELEEAVPGPFNQGDLGSVEVAIPPFPSFAKLCVQGIVDDLPGPIVCCEARTVAMSDLSCSTEDGSAEVFVSWESFVVFDEIEVYVNGQLHETLDGEETELTIESLSVPSSVTIEVIAHHGASAPTMLACSLPLVTTATVTACVDVTDLPEVSAGAVQEYNLTIEEDFPIGFVEVPLELTALASWELGVSLTSPQGTRVQLYGPEFFSSRLPNAVFSEVGEPHDSGKVDCQCLMDVRGPGDLEDYKGEPCVGDWALCVANDYFFSFTTTVDRWCLRLDKECDLSSPTTLECSVVADGIELTWINSEVYESVDVLRNGKRIATVLGDSEEFLDTSAPAGHLRYAVVAKESCGVHVTCSVDHRLVEDCVADLAESLDPSASVVISVLDGLPIADVELAITIVNETDDNDYEATLTSPSGTEVRLFSGSAYDLDVIFSDSGTSVDRSLYGTGGRVRPVWPSEFADFQGESSDGLWVLDVSSNAFGEATIEEVCLLVYEDTCPPLSLLDCTVEDREVELSWSRASFDSIDVFSNGELVASLPGDATDVSFTRVRSGAYRFVVVGSELGCESSESCWVAVGMDECCSFPSLVFEPGSEEEAFVETMEVSNFGTISQLDASVDWTGDSAYWSISVESPLGTEVVLHDRHGLSGSVVARFSDFGAPNTPLYQDQLDYGCGCLLQPSSAGLSAFVGESGEGEWSLVLTGNDDAGLLSSWCVYLAEDCEELAPSSVVCTAAGDAVELSWENESDYEFIDVYRGSEVVAVLTDGEELFTDEDVPPGRWEYEIVATIEGAECGASSAPCVVEHRLFTACADASEISNASVRVRDRLSFTTEFLIGDVEISFSALGVAATHELTVESPAGTEVVLSARRPSAFSTVGVGSLEVVFSDRGLPFDTQRLGDGVRMKALGPGSLSDFEGEVSRGAGTWTLSYSGFLESIEEWCVQLVPLPGQVLDSQFVRGDSDGNGDVFPILDALYVLEYGFTGGPAPECLDAADADDDGIVFAILDALFLLDYGFNNGPSPAQPGPDECGTDGTDDDLDCLTAPGCS